VQVVLGDGASALAFLGGIVRLTARSLFVMWSRHRTAALGALGHGLTTVALFVYLLIFPWITGIEPNVRRRRLLLSNLY
jgi:hypothetical protein